MAKRKAKHPREMTTDELVKHVFHPKVAKHLKRIAHEGNPPKGKKK